MRLIIIGCSSIGTGTGRICTERLLKKEVSTQIVTLTGDTIPERGLKITNKTNNFKIESGYLEDQPFIEAPKKVYRADLRLRYNKNSWRGKDKSRKNFKGGRALNRMK